MKKAILTAAFLLVLWMGIAFAEDVCYFEKDAYQAAPLSGDWTYTVEDTSILRISTYGKFKGIKLGKTRIRAVNGEEVKTLEAEVVTKITGLSLSEKEITLLEGDVCSIPVSIKPANANKKVLKYSTGDETIAVVDADGTVRAVGVGTCRITVFSAEKSAVLTVTVRREVTGMEFSQDAYTVDVGNSLQLSLLFEPEGASDKVVTWKSSDPSVATVKNGKVSAKKAGETAVTASLSNGILAECTVSVQIPVQKITLKKSSITVPANTDFRVECTVTPSNATDQKLTYVSSDPAVATVDENGNITGRSRGNCRITVTSSNGKKAVAEVKVTWTAVKGLNNYTLQAGPKVGETYRIKAETDPADASDPVLLYSSSAPEIAAVDENGVITAIREGSAVITLATREGNFISECKVTVRASKEGRLDGVVIGINPGHQIRQNTKQYPIAPGSKTTGALNSGCAVGVKTKKYEYQLNLEVSLLLRDLLEEAGATVIMVRTTNDVELTNIERAEMLNTAQVDLAIQVHANKSDKKTKQGLSTYSRFSGDLQEVDYVASKLIHDAMLETTGAKDAGINLSNNYMSLNYSTTPAILVEMGYMSNPEEDVLLSAPEYQQKLAQGLFNGICDFMGR